MGFYGHVMRCVVRRGVVVAKELYVGGMMR